MVVNLGTGFVGACGAKPIETVVMPVGGWGSRLSRRVASVPKNLLPLGETVLIDHAVDEALLAGAKNIVIVCSPRYLRAYKQQFNPMQAQFDAVRSESKAKQRAELENLRAKGEKITFVVQKEAKGLGHAILQAKEHVKGDFGVILPDDPILDNNLNAVGLPSIAQYHKTGAISLARVEVKPEDTSRYGIFNFGDVSFDPEEPTQVISGVVEKPETDAPSNCAIMGRYILPEAIFEILAEEKIGAADEIQLTDAIDQLMQQGTPAYATKYVGTRLDCGTPEGYAVATNFVNSKLYPHLFASQKLEGSPEIKKF